MNHCGTCTACCKVFAIAELAKPAGDWCKHCDVGVGCKVYADRPNACVDFQCLWLLSQERGPRERLPEALRPDRCKVVFSATTNENVVAGTIMPGYSVAYAQTGPARSLIETLVGGGVSVVLGRPKATTRFLVDKRGAHPVRLTEPDADGMQWNIPD